MEQYHGTSFKAIFISRHPAWFLDRALMGNGDDVDLCFYGLSKAFDIVNHKTFCAKLVI